MFLAFERLKKVGFVAPAMPTKRMACLTHWVAQENGDATESWRCDALRKLLHYYAHFDPRPVVARIPATFPYGAVAPVACWSVH